MTQGKRENRAGTLLTLFCLAGIVGAVLCLRLTGVEEMEPGDPRGFAAVLLGAGAGTWIGVKFVRWCGMIDEYPPSASRWIRWLL